MDKKTKTGILGALRNEHRKYSVKKEAMRQAMSLTEKGIRGGRLYFCNECGLCFPAKEIQMDHIDPVIPVNKSYDTMDWNEIMERMFSPIENYQCLCRNCHLIKCDEEREDRYANKI